MNDIHSAIYNGVPRLQLFIDGGHCVMWENPSKARQLIMNFVQAPVRSAKGLGALSRHSTPKSSLRNLRHHQLNSTDSSKFKTKALLQSA